MLGIKLPKSSLNQQSYSLEQLAQGGIFEIDVSILRIKLTMPQNLILHKGVDNISPEFWDKGMSAIKLGYNATYYKSNNISNKSSSDQIHLRLDSGVNIKSWQLYDNFSFYKNSGDNFKLNSRTRYIRKPLPLYRSNFIAGDFYSEGGLFDSVRVRGISLGSDINMLPTSEQRFSPTITGVAQTNAFIKVIQNGTIIYQENVPPGQFEIKNIQPVSFATDLLVVIKEANGQEQSFTVPFTYIPGMLKKDISNYSLFLGRVNKSNSNYQPKLIQVKFEHGFNNLTTGYIGTTVSEDYQSYLVGSTWNFPIGAIAVDITHANTKLPYTNLNGKKTRVAYSKFLNKTETNFNLTVSRYSNEDYYSFNEVIHEHERYSYYNKFSEKQYSPFKFTNINFYNSIHNLRPKNIFTVNLNQQLPSNWGTMYISGYHKEYWSEHPITKEYQLGYSNSYSKINYSISLSRVHNDKNQEENRYYISISLPILFGDRDLWLNTGVSAGSLPHQQTTVSLSGTAFESNKLNYSLSSASQQKRQNMVSANFSYRSNISTIGSSVSRSNNYNQTSLSARGSLVAIPWKILASNEIGNTMTIVKAPEAQDLIVNGDRSLTTNKSGFALIPYATPYRKNIITLSSGKDTNGAKVIGNIANNIPIEGAVNLVTFKTDTRSSWFSRTVHKNGKALPFGAEVISLEGDTIGYIGQASVLYLKAAKFPKAVIVKLNDSSCLIHNLSDHLDGHISVCQ
jgi:outer membrane usher protein